MVCKHRGVAVIMVLGLLVITLALSYAMMRSSTMSAMIQSNSHRRGDARQAAMSGVSAALRKIRHDDWAGIGTTMTGTLSASMRYQVSYSLGDPSLASSDPDWEDYAYRITIDSIGYASVPSQPTLVSEHKIRVVVSLAPEQMPAEPTDWSNFQQYTVFQAENASFQVELPARIEGPVRVQGELRLATDYPPDTEVVGGSRLLFVVRSASSLTSQESLRQTKFNELGYTVHLIGENSPQSAYDAAVASNDVLYVSEEVLSTNLNTKAKEFVIDCINDERFLADEFGIASSSGDLYAMAILDIIDNTHHVTSDFTTGLTTILTPPDSGGRLTGSRAPDLQVLGRWGTSDALAVVAAGGALYDGGFAAGRRVQLPWTGRSFDFANVDENGEKILLRALEWGSRGNPRRRYLRDLEVIRLTSSADYRPFDGPLKLPLSAQATATIDELTDLLGVTIDDVPAASVASDWQKPTNPTSYRIYQDGPVYTVATVNGTLQDTTLQPDPLTNPLGIFYCSQTITLRDNVTIRGTLVCHHDIKVTGQNVRFESVDLPSLYDTSGPVRLPVATCRSFMVEDSGSGSLKGLLCVFDKFEIKSGPASAAFGITGRVVVQGELHIHARNEWNNVDFSARYRDFANQASQVRFPQWLGTQSYSPQPLLTIEPDPVPVTYHWLDPTAGTPVFVPKPNPDGLTFHWDVIDWIDNP